MKRLQTLPSLLNNHGMTVFKNVIMVIIITISPTLILLSYTDYALNNTLMCIMINIRSNYDTHMFPFIHIFKSTSYSSNLSRSPFYRISLPRTELFFHIYSNISS